MMTEAILAHASPFTVATWLNRPAVDPAPFGITTRWHIDPLDSRNAPFFFQLQRLDRLTFGPEGMPMARWIFYNMAELPGFIHGFAIPHDDLSSNERAALEVPADYRGPVPIAMYIAIPIRGRGLWFGHNLASLNRLLPERRLAGLGTLTKALGLAAYGVETSFGATQWTSKALHIHARFGPLRLHTAWTPAHSIPSTLTYSWAVDGAALRQVVAGEKIAGSRPAPTRFIGERDHVGMRELQAEIEAGARWWIVGQPVTGADGVAWLPLAERPT